MGWSASKLQTWVDEIEALDIWMAAFSADPEGAGDPALLEIIGGTYVRQTSAWTRTSALTLTLASPVIFSGIPPGGVIAAIGGFDDAFAGTFLFSDLLPDPESYPSGGTYVLPAGEFVVGFE